METVGNELLAKAAYEGYWQHTGGKSLATGTAIPGWDGLREDIRAAWAAAADAVVLRVRAMIEEMEAAGGGRTRTY